MFQREFIRWGAGRDAARQVQYIGGLDVIKHRRSGYYIWRGVLQEERDHSIRYDSNWEVNKEKNTILPFFLNHWEIKGQADSVSIDFTSLPLQECITSFSIVHHTLLVMTNDQTQEEWNKTPQFFMFPNHCYHPLHSTYSTSSHAFVDAHKLYSWLELRCRFSRVCAHTIYQCTDSSIQCFPSLGSHPAR